MKIKAIYRCQSCGDLVCTEQDHYEDPSIHDLRKVHTEFSYHINKIYVSSSRTTNIKYSFITPITKLHNCSIDGSILGRAEFLRFEKDTSEEDKDE